MNYKNLLITDKYDIDKNIKFQFPGCKIIESNDDLKYDKNIKILSCNKLKITKKIIKLFPNLKWIILRKSNYEKFNSWVYF